jgi:1-acyl-sn-glycerol-3-phosphate acyltransferase
VRRLLLLLLAASPGRAQILRAPALDAALSAPSAASVSAALATPTIAPLGPTATFAAPLDAAPVALVPFAPEPDIAVAVPAAAAPAAPAALPALRGAAAWAPPARPTSGESLRGEAGAAFAEPSSGGSALAAAAADEPPPFAAPALSPAPERAARAPAPPPAPRAPEPKPFFLRHYRLARSVVIPLLKLIYRIDVQGRVFLPAGPALIVPNHVTYMDPILVSFAANRPMRFLMYRGLYETPGLEWLFRALGAMPISAQDPRAVTAATLERARRALADGETVVIFPEGRLTRDGELDVFRRGFERIASGAGVPVIPAGVSGLWGSAFSRAPGASFGRGLLACLHGRRRVSVRFGSALDSVDADSAKSAVAALRGARR